MKIQVREPHLLTVELETELWEVENGQRADITDAAAVTIASWYQSPGAVGYVLAAFASGCEVDHADLLADIDNTASTQTSAELGHLAAWVNAAAEAAETPEAGQDEVAERGRGDLTADRRERLTRDSIVADAKGRQAGHLAARTAGPDTAAVREQLTREHGNGGYPEGPIAADYRTGFAFGWAAWTAHRATQPTPDPAPFQAHDPAALAACLKTYDDLQPDADKATELYTKAEHNQTLWTEADDLRDQYNSKAATVLDDLITALRGPSRPQRVHYTELAEGDIVTEHETQFRVIARGEYTRAGHLVQWVSTEAVTEPSDQLSPFVYEVGDPWRLQAREDIAYTYRITPENPLTH